MFSKLSQSLTIFILALSSLFSFNLNVNAEPFTADTTYEVLNVSDCNLSIKFNRSKFDLDMITNPKTNTVSYYISSNLDPYKVFVHIFCYDTGNYTYNLTGDLGPYWTGYKPDISQGLTRYMKLLSYASNPEISGYINFVKATSSQSKSANISYVYKTREPSLEDLKNGVFNTQAGITNDDLQIKVIDVPTVSTPNTESINTQNSTTTTPTQGESPKEEKIDNRKFISCEGKIGKRLNSNGDIIARAPKGKNVIYADTTGRALVTENDYVNCVRNAKRYGVVNCTGKNEMYLNSKGRKLNYYPRGKVLYSWSADENIFISSKAIVNCTENFDLVIKGSN